MTKYTAVLQARNGSSRLPGKLMKEVLGEPILFYLIERIKAIPAIGEIIIATTTNPADDVMVEWANTLGVSVFRGDEENVLGRIYECASSIDEDYFVKFWGDSPLIDPSICQEIIERAFTDFAGYDYISNNHPSTYPEGMQIEIIKISTLEAVSKLEDITDSDREHVTPGIIRNSHLFKIGNIEHSPNIHDEYRIVLDYPEDYLQIKNIIEALYPNSDLFNMNDIISFLDDKPQVKEINRCRYDN